MTQEEKIIARINELGFPIKIDDPMRQSLLDLADSLTEQAEKGKSNKSLLAVIGLLSFAVASLCEK